LKEDSEVSVTQFNPESLAPPIGFSHAVLGEGKFIYLAGQTALNKENVIVGSTIVEQFEKALSSLCVALETAGGAPKDLVKITIFSVDPANYRAHSREIGKVWQRLIGKNFPAMTLVGVTRLWDEEALVEIDGVACIS
jgi:enamine deaminase RidA (YjgF/YER057c/UK114 family)